MTNSDRVKIKLAILSGLRGRADVEIELILHEFSAARFSWHHWQGDIDSFIIACLGEAEDHALHEIASHLGVGVDPAATTHVGMPSFWKVDHFRLFISHHNKDKAPSGRLRDALGAYYISAFVAHEDIETTAEWQREIESALRTMDAMVTLHRPEFRESVWTDQEVGWALGRGRLVVPIRVRADPHGFIAKHQALLLREKTSAPEVATQIYDIVRRHLLTRDRMLEALSARFAAAASFASAREYLKPLEEAEALSQPILERLRKAYESNVQVNKATDVPERLNALFERHGFRGAMIQVEKTESDIPF